MYIFYHKLIHYIYTPHCIHPRQDDRPQEDAGPVHLADLRAVRGLPRYTHAAVGQRGVYMSM